MEVVECFLDREKTILSVLFKICHLYGKDSSNKRTAIIPPQSSHFYLPDVIERVLLHSLALFRPLSCRPTKFVLVTSFREEYVMKLALRRAGQRSFLITQALHLNTPDVYTLASLKVQMQSTVLCTRCSSAFLKKTQEIRSKCIASWNQSYIPPTPSPPMLLFTEETIVPHFETCLLKTLQ